MNPQRGMREPIFTFLMSMVRTAVRTWFREAVRDTRRSYQNAVQVESEKAERRGTLRVIDPLSSTQHEAIDALVSLGWRKREAETRVRLVSSDSETNASEIVRLALAHS